MNSKEYCTEALESKCVHTRYRLDVFIQLIQLAKPSPVRPPGFGGGKAIRPLLSSPAPLQLRQLTIRA